LLASVALAVLVIAAAGIAGSTHFAGPRWFPNLTIRRHTRRPQTLPAGPSTRLAPPSSRHVGSFALGSIVLWIVVGLALLAVAVLVWRWWAGRPSGAARGRHSLAVAATSDVVAEPQPEPDVPSLRTGIELALQVLDEQRDPADAIVRAWLGLQETAEQSGIVRGPAETPTEFSARILSRAFADDAALRTLLALYLRTRFGDHPVTVEDVAAVRAALQELVRTWMAAPSA
jgi:hypothetical protein